MTKEDQFFQKRIQDLAMRAWQRGVYTYSDFLNADQQSIFWQIESELPKCGYRLFGGVEDCERQMIRFGNEELVGYEETFPIACVEVAPVQAKFAEKLSHRDYLGALMHLGFERTMLGDILTRDKTGFVFCQEKIADYIVEQLTMVRHTSVRSHRLDEMPQMPEIEKIAEHIVVNSLRADALIAKSYHMSRNQSLSLFAERKVFINGRETETGSVMLRTGDVVSVRGYGKFECGACAPTKKGKFGVQIQHYG